MYWDIQLQNPAHNCVNINFTALPNIVVGLHARMEIKFKIPF